MHGAEQIPPAEAEHAIEIASAVLEDLFPRVIAMLALKTDGRLHILEK